MTTSTRPPTTWAFWLVAILILLWNLFGVSNYLMSAMADSESLARQDYTAEQIAFLMDMPPLYLSVFALAVWSGLLGAILLLLRKSWAVPVMLFSLVFVLISLVLDAVGGSFKVMGVGYLIIMCVVTIVAFLELWFARRMRTKGILR